MGLLTKMRKGADLRDTVAQPRGTSTGSVSTGEEYRVQQAALSPEQRRLLALKKVRKYREYGQRLLEKAAESEIRLTPLQLQALSCVSEEGGGFFPIGVGHGKTFIALLAATSARRKAAMVLAPSATIPQMRREEQRLRREGFRLATVHYLGYGAVSSQKPGEDSPLETWYREAVSSAGLTEKDAILVLDEAHKVGRMESSRTRRVLRFVRAHPEIAVITLSGTSVQTPVDRYAHLMALALRERSPTPLDVRVLARWTRVLNTDTQEEERSGDWLEVYPILAQHGLKRSGYAGRKAKKVAAREAYYQYLDHAAGVVGSGDLSCSAGIELSRVTKIAGYKQETLDVLAKLLETGQSPDGEEEYESPSAVGRAATQLSLGYYYRWEWPGGVPDKEWLLTRAEWNRLIRWEIQTYAKEGYDSPALVEHAVREGTAVASSLPYLQRALAEWDKHRHKPPPPTVPVWLDYAVVDAAAAWAKETKGAVWYQSKAICDELCKRMNKVWKRGDDAVDSSPHAAAYSIRAHGTGLNLQGYDKALIMEPPMDMEPWEQLLGRHHRKGQTAESIRIQVMSHTPYMANKMRRVKEEASFPYSNVQRLQLARWTTCHL